MVNCRRSEFEIIGKILDLSKDGAKKTDLLHHGNFSYIQLEGYLSFLMGKDILKINENDDNGTSGKYYTLTEKGQNLLFDINKTLTYLR